MPRPRKALAGPWAKFSGRERGTLLFKLADQIEAHAEELAGLEVLDNGKPIGEVKADANGEWVFVPKTPLPPGSRLFTMPGGDVIGWDSAAGAFAADWASRWGGPDCLARPAWRWPS